MAFNITTFKTRALTAVVFAIVMLTGLLWNQWSFLLLFSVIHFGCWAEYQKLLGIIDKAYLQIPVLHKYGVMFAGWGLMLWMTHDSYQVAGLQVNSMGKWLLLLSLAVMAISWVLNDKTGQLRLMAHSLMGLVYISLSWALMMRLWTNLDQSVFTGQNWIMPVWLIASIWINDTMAYLVGSFFGKTALSAISPNKTWEGTIGGAILVVIVVVLTGYYGFHFPVKALVLISLTAAIAGTAGDLFESKLKRLAGVKDSGTFMPGHGGFLDRFDSLLWATTAVWVIFYLFY